MCIRDREGTAALRAIAERLRSFAHRHPGLYDSFLPAPSPDEDPEAVEERMSDDIAAAIYEGDRCIECGCCVASCGVANIDDNFLAGAGMNRVARFMMDPRDSRTDGDWFEVVAGEQGVFGCYGMMACADVCPKELPLLDVYSYLRRKALGAFFVNEDEKRQA